MIFKALVALVKNWFMWLALIIEIGFLITATHHPEHLALMLIFGVIAICCGLGLAFAIHAKSAVLTHVFTWPGGILALAACYEVWRVFAPSQARDTYVVAAFCTVVFFAFFVAVCYSFITGTEHSH